MPEISVASTETTRPHPGPPRMLHHVTYVTYDSEATTRFYTQIMGMPLICTVMDDHLPSTGVRTPYFHTFFRMGDGSTLAFFESPGLAALPPYPDAAFDNFNHLAMEVGSKENVDAWQSWLEQHDVEVQLVDHGIIYSLYFHDPNGVRLEITATIEPSWQSNGQAAADAMNDWVQAKADAAAAGESPDERLRKLISSHAHQAQLREKRATE